MLIGAEWLTYNERANNAAAALVWICRHVSLLPLDHDFESKIAKRFDFDHHIL